jgi:hypothetical protein
MELEARPARTATALGLGRLTLLLLVSTLGIAGFFHVMYGAGLITAMVVVAEIGVILLLAFAYAWRACR